MNGPTCLTQGCGRVARRGHIGYSGYCERCRQRWRARGAVDQVPIRKLEAGRYVRRIQRLLKGGNLDKIETFLREQHSLLIECVTTLGEMKGIWGPQRRERTITEMLRVLKAVDPVRSGLTVAALFLMRDQQSYRFFNDQAFRFQLVRLWRSNTRLSFGSYYNEKTDKTVSTYKPLPPRIIEAIAGLLIQAYSKFAAYCIRADEQALKKRQAHATALAEGFAPLLTD